MVWLLLLVPASLVAQYLLHLPPLWVFVLAILAIVPLAEFIRRATVQLADRSGPAVGGLLNVTFGNTAELILALFVLRTGEVEVVKAQITGSIIGNTLLGLGLAVLVGSIGRRRQTFSKDRAGLLSSLLILSLLGLLVPALFSYTEHGRDVVNVAALNERLSLGVAAVLIVVYLANLLYTLVTHSDVYASVEGHGTARWSLWASLGVLVAATAATAVEAELVSRGLLAAAGAFGLTPFFLGITVLAVVGNAAEYLAAIVFARQDRMGLVLSITVGSSIQVALLVAPALVLLSYAMGTPMDLVFSNPLELIAVAGAAFIVNAIAADGETTWFEGVLLVAVYAVLGMAFFFAVP